MTDLDLDAIASRKTERCYDCEHAGTPRACGSSGPYVMLTKRERDALVTMAREALEHRNVKEQVSTKVRCTVCGLIYSPDKPLPCRSEDGPNGPAGFTDEMRQFARCTAQPKYTRKHQ